MALVSATRLRVRSPWTLPAFFLHALRSGRQARHAPGSLAVAVLNDRHRTYWTCSVWTDVDAMRRFMGSGAHRASMRRLAGWCDEASVVHWEQATPVLPDWQEVHRRMQQDGRPSRVERPSPDHLAWRVPPPRQARSVRLK